VCVDGRDDDGKRCVACRGTGECPTCSIDAIKARADELFAWLVASSYARSVELPGEVRAGVYARAFAFWVMHDGIPESRMHSLLDEAAADLKADVAQVLK